MISYRQADLFRRILKKRDEESGDDIRPQIELTLNNLGDGMISAEFEDQSTYENNRISIMPTAVRDSGFIYTQNSFIYNIPEDEQDNGPMEARHIETIVDSLTRYLERKDFEVWEKKNDNAALTGGRLILWCTYLK